MLRELLAERTAFGTFVKMPSADVIEILALCGFDFAICDLEHSQMSPAECTLVLQAARAAALPVVVRVPQLDRGLINRVLEAGAAGVQLPRTASLDDASALASLMRYPPVGTRSMSQAQPAARYGAEPLLDYLDRANAGPLAVGQFETAELAEPLDEAVAALDVAFIGSLDLSIAAGAPGDEDAPAVRALVDRVAAAAQRTGRHLGVFAGSVGAAQRAAKAGYRYIAVSSDLAMLRASARDLLAELREARRA